MTPNIESIEQQAREWQEALYKLGNACIDNGHTPEDTDSLVHHRYKATGIIAGLLAELTQLRNATRWRSVEEELPEERMLVLTLLRDPNYSIYAIAELTDEPETRWQNLHSGCTVHPTHWMPLPTLPPNNTTA